MHPGNYASAAALGIDNDSMSSCRRIRSERTAKSYVFQGSEFTGRARILTGAVPKFSNMAFDDMKSSIIVTDGAWTFYRDSLFQNTAWTLTPGYYSSAIGNFDDDGLHKYNQALVY